MTVHICRRMQVMMPVSDGVLHSMQALAKQASAVSDGETLTNRAYYTGLGKALINQSPSFAESVKINGVVSGCVVTPGAGNDNAAVAAGVANINGVAVTVAADTSNAIPLPASGKYAIVALSVTTNGTGFTATAGVDGDALDWSAYGGAGQMPLCPVDNVVLAYIARFSNTPAVITAANIFAGESANIPYAVDSIRGYFVLPAALPLSYAGPLSRPVFAQWYSQDGSILQPITEAESCKLSVKVSTLNITPASCQWEKHHPGRSSFTSSVGAYKTTDNYLLDKILSGGANARAFVKARVNASDTSYFLGEVCMTGLDLDLKFGEIMLPYELQGTGELCRLVG